MRNKNQQATIDWITQKNRELTGTLTFLGGIAEATKQSFFRIFVEIL